MTITAVILAAGQGTRMKSRLPKVLFPLLGRPMINYSIDVAVKVTGTKPVVVIGHHADAVRKAVGDQVDYVHQEPQLGTGHAVKQTENLLRGKSDMILVTAADMPLMRETTIQRLVQLQERNPGPLTIISLEADAPRGFGRVVRDAAGEVQAIVEEVQAAPEQLEIRELNAGVYCVDAEWLWEALRRIPISPKGEYYLTDLVGIAVSDGLLVQALLADDAEEMIGINTRVHLSEAEAIMRMRVNQSWMLAGVTMIDPASVYIEPDVRIGVDTVIWPNTCVLGETAVGEGCVLGPNSVVRDTQIGDRCRVLASVLESAVLEDDVDIGPYGHLRDGAHLAQGVHMGNFGEVKNSYLGAGSKMGHFSYLGDATLGPQVNIGAGVITCNYDGENKHPTEIGAGAFIGSDTMLVAPLTVGEGSRTGAGSVVTKDVPPGSMVVGIPARAIRKTEK